MQNETERTVEATESQLRKLTKLYKEALAPNIRYIPINNLDYDSWLILRSIAGIGASEISTALGKNPPYFKGTPYRVWSEKSGNIIKIEDTPRLRMGRRQEPITRDEFVFLTGREVIVPKDKMFIHPIEDRLFCNLDGVIMPAGGEGYGILECKSTTSYTYESWLEKIPPYYFRQAQGELSVINKHPAFGGAEFNYVEFAVYLQDRWTVETLRIMRDDAFIEKQNFELVNWWNEFVDGNVPPPLGVSEYARLDPMEDSFITASAETFKNYEKLLEVKKHQAAVEEERAELEEKIKAEMKDNEVLLWEGEEIATWKQTKKTTVDSKKLKAEEPKIFKKYSKVTPSRTFRTKSFNVLEY